MGAGAYKDMHSQHKQQRHAPASQTGKYPLPSFNTCLTPSPSLLPTIPSPPPPPHPPLLASLLHSAVVTLLEPVQPSTAPTTPQHAATPRGTRLRLAFPLLTYAYLCVPVCGRVHVRVRVRVRVHIHIHIHICTSEICCTRGLKRCARMARRTATVICQKLVACSFSSEPLPLQAQIERYITFTYQTHDTFTLIEARCASHCGLSFRNFCP